jgi:hypothetical protein
MTRSHYKAAKRQKELAKKKKKEEKLQRRLQKKNVQPDGDVESSREEAHADTSEDSDEE